MNRLNLGSGLDIREGWDNLDMNDKNGANVIFNLENIFKGKRLPFKNCHFDYVYCSHLLEDFIDPMPIIKEIIRVTKNNSKIELRFPSETNLWLTNIYHKRAFSFTMFDYLVDNMENYVEEYDLEVVDRKFYCDYGKSILNNSIKKISEIFCNVVGYKIIETTFLKYIFPNINLKIVLVKNPSPIITPTRTWKKY